MSDFTNLSLFQGVSIPQSNSGTFSSPSSIDSIVLGNNGQFESIGANTALGQALSNNPNSTISSTIGNVTSTFGPQFTIPATSNSFTDTLSNIPSIFGSATTGTSAQGLSNTSSSTKDTRIRLSAPAGQEDILYGPNDGSLNVLQLLHKTQGVLFPYTPSITVSQDVDYRTTDLVHSNGDIYSYTRTPSVALSVQGKFTVQNLLEGQYAIAVIHFLRAASKMYFGEKDDAAGLAGTPPPVLIFSGYGDYMFNNIKVVLKSHSFSLEENIDYVQFSTPDGYVAKLPAMFSVSLTLGVLQSPTAMRKDFSLTDFRTGALMRAGKTGWI